MFVVENLRVALGELELKASFSVGPGQALHLSGPSGAGKTTLLRALVLLEETKGGEVYLDGKPWNSFPPPLWRRLVGFLPQVPVMFPGTVEDNLRAPFSTKNARGQKYDRSEALNLCSLLKLPSSTLDRDAQTLSGGEAARVALARACLLYTSPSPRD